ncbi:unnamed protein product [Chrysoparadoxa australica]
MWDRFLLHVAVACLSWEACFGLQAFQPHLYRSFRTGSALSVSREGTNDLSEPPLLTHLAELCAEAVRVGQAMDSDVTGSSEWSGFRTEEPLLIAVSDCLARASPRMANDGSSLAWSWMAASPKPLRLRLAGEDKFGIFLTVLAAGCSPPAQRAQLGSRTLSKLLQGGIIQVKANSQRVIGETKHRAGDDAKGVWSSFGGGVRRLESIGDKTVLLLEVVFAGRREACEYDTRDKEPGAAERNAEAAALMDLQPVMVVDGCPCDASKLLADAEVAALEGDMAGDSYVLVKRQADGRLLGKEAQVDTLLQQMQARAAVSSLTSSVGGLDDQLNEITRRFLSSRSLPPHVRQALGVQHVRGMLLYGPPGCGKTLMARELAARLGARPPKLVSGPEILDKWVGEAERKVRMLFMDAEMEHNKCIDNGGDPFDLPLHVICFDEIDALCRGRGQLAGDTSGVRDSVVNQILAKLDGLTALQNVLVVGMTNRKELLDEALVRPGRLEVSIFVPLPTEKGRRDILDIHLSQARQSNMIGEISTEDLAAVTEGFSGADLAGLVRSAFSFAVQRWLPENGGEGLHPQGEIMVGRGDFEAALREVKPSVAQQPSEGDGSKRMRIARSLKQAFRQER